MSKIPKRQRRGHCGRGAAITRILLRGGARDIVVCDREGVINMARLPGLNDSKAWLAQHTNPRKLRGRLEDALVGANAFIGVSGRGLLHAKQLKRMARKPLVFAMANPTPEIMPEEAARVAFIVATGRSGYPNQINNVLAFPGIFRGALDVRARRITEEMKHAAARAIAGCIGPLTSRSRNPQPPPRLSKEQPLSEGVFRDAVEQRRQLPAGHVAYRIASLPIHDSSA